MSPGRTITQGACQQNWRVLVEGANVQISMFSKRAINIGFQSKGLKMNQKGGKNCVFGPKDVCFFFQKEPGSAATVLSLIVQPGLVPSPSERRLSMPYIVPPCHQVALVAHK